VAGSPLRQLPGAPWNSVALPGGAVATPASYWIAVLAPVGAGCRSSATAPRARPASRRSRTWRRCPRRGRSLRPSRTVRW